MNNLKRIKYLLIIVIFSGIKCQAMKRNTPVYKDKSQPVELRVKDLLSRMTLEEKIAQMCQYVGIEHIKHAQRKIPASELLKNDALGYYPGFSIDSLISMTKKGLIGSFLHVLTAEETNQLQKYAMQSRLQIPLIIGIDAIHGNAMVKGTTVYPTPIGMASTWSTELVEKLHRETAFEMRATGSHWSFTPNVDVARDARWGRVGETFGEDPYMVSQMGVAAIKGLQGNNMQGKDEVVSCIKHLVGGSQSLNGLNAAPTDISERTLREVFLPPYKASVENGAFSVMTAHNEYNGVPCHSSKYLMEDILRKEWGFKGFVVSDWMDIERIHKLHKVAETMKEASFLSVDAGMDMHMHGPHFSDHLKELVNEGRLTEDRINQSVSKILTAKFKLGLFENPYIDLKKVDDVVFTKKHQETALEAARKSITLLKNDGILPLKKGKYKKILVTGPNANNQTIMGDWAMEQPDEKCITIYEGIKEIASGSEVEFFNSGEIIKKIKDSDIKKAAKKASKSDLAIVVVGENSMRYKWADKTCGENMARARIDLAGKQLELVKKIHKTGTPVLVILVNGRPLGLTWVDKNIPAIIEAWEPGSFGGQAVAEIIYGKINPSGKLPITVPRSVGQIQTYYNHKPSHFFHKYTAESKKPLYSFGYGLSYTKYHYSNLKTNRSDFGADQKIILSVNVKNTGEVDGEEVVQLYIRDNYSSATRPVKELKGFKRVSLKSGESKKVEFEITPEMLAYYDINMKYTTEKGKFTLMVGSSSGDKDLLKCEVEYK